MVRRGLLAAECIALGVRSTRWSQTLAQNRDSCIPNVQCTRLSHHGGSRRNIAMTFGTVRKNCPMMKKIEDVFIRFDRIYERDRRTDGHRIVRMTA